MKAVRRGYITIRRAMTRTSAALLRGAVACSLAGSTALWGPAGRLRPATLRTARTLMHAHATNADDNLPTPAPETTPVWQKGPRTHPAASRGRDPRLVRSADGRREAIATVRRIARHGLRGARLATARPDVRQPLLAGGGPVAP